MPTLAAAWRPGRCANPAASGIHLHGIRYWSSALTVDVGREADKLLVKHDPRDLSRVFVRRLTGAFIEARCANPTLPPITSSEAKAASRALRAKGRREVDASTLVRAAVAQRTSTEDATRRSRPGRATRPALASGRAQATGETLGSLRGIDLRTPTAALGD